MKFVAEGRAASPRPSAAAGRRRRRRRPAAAAKAGSVVMAKSFHELSPRAQIDRLRAAVRARRRRRAGRCSIGPERRRARDAPRAAGEARERSRPRAGRSPTGCRRSSAKCGRSKWRCARHGGRFRTRRTRRTSCATCTSWPASRRSTSRGFKPKPRRRQGAVLRVADSARPRGRLPRPRPLLRSARRDVAADLGVRSRHQDQDASRTGAAASP